MIICVTKVLNEYKYFTRSIDYGILILDKG